MGRNLVLIAWLAVRNLVLHRVKSFVVGGILFFGTFLLVVGGSVVTTLQGTLERSITSSLAGHIQLYDQDARDTLALFPSGSPGTADVGEIPDFQPVHDVALGVPNVRDVVPMGLLNAIVLGETETDRLVSHLRRALDADPGTPGDGLGAEARLVLEELRQVAAGLEGDVRNAGLASADPAQVEAQVADLARLRESSFEADLMRDPEATLSFLESRVAPLASDGRSFYLRLLGAPLDQFTATFDRFRVVDGTPVPDGQPGLLLSKRTYETQFKNEVARSLDVIRDGLADGRTLAEDALLRSEVDRAVKLYRRVLYQLPPDRARDVEAALRDALPGTDPGADLATLLQVFLRVDDATFQDRYRLFYEVVAPAIRLYEVPVGEEVVLRSFTRSGYARAVSVRLYGTFQFTGLETSDLAGVNQLVDLASFRSLYGKMTTEQQAELAGIRESVGVRDVSREDAEAALFGGDPVSAAPEAAAVSPGEPAGGDDPPVQGASATAARSGTPASPRHGAEEAEAGLVLNAAVVLDDPSRLAETREALQQAFSEAGLRVQAVGWRTAAGLVGQLITVIQAVLGIGVSVVFVVAMAIINNTLMMSALSRTQEVGTLRAIGTQRSFVLGMFLVETALLGLVAGGLGALAGVGVVAVLGEVGIPAVADILVLVFGGPRLYPTWSPLAVVGGIGIVVLFALVSAASPTLLATRVSPVVAMSPKE